MELMEGLQIIRKMCKQNLMTCVGCPLDTRCPLTLTPHQWDDDDTKHIVAAAEEWAKEHTKTRLDALKERFPFAPVYEDTGLPMSCPKAYFGQDISKACERLNSCTDAGTCRECWNMPAPAMYQDKEE